MMIYCQCQSRRGGCGFEKKDRNAAIANSHSNYQANMINPQY